MEWENHKKELNYCISALLLSSLTSSIPLPPQYLLNIVFEKPKAYILVTSYMTNDCPCPASVVSSSIHPQPRGPFPVLIFPVLPQKWFPYKGHTSWFPLLILLKTTLCNSIGKLTSFAAPYYAISSSLRLLYFQYWQPFIKPFIFPSAKSKCFCKGNLVQVK